MYNIAQASRTPFMRWGRTPDPVPFYRGTMKSPSSHTILKVVAFLFMTSVIDLGLTVCLRHDAHFYELNPLVRGFLDNNHIITLSVYKILVTIVGCFFIFLGLKQGRTSSIILVLYVAVPIHVLLLLNWLAWLIGRSVI